MSKQNYTIEQLNSADYDSRFAELARALDTCAESQDCDFCALKDDCRTLFDTLADRATHYRVTAEQYDRFMEHFKKLKKQLAFTFK